MLRPIDTQTILNQIQEIATREALHKVAESAQQDQFANLLQKEAHIKQDTVKALEKEEKVDNDLNKKKNSHQGKQQKRGKQPAAEKKQDAKQKQNPVHQGIDIRI